MTNNAERELLPCPFCGGKAKIGPEDPELEGDGWTQVHCANAECSVDPSVECFEDGHKESAIRIWNTRAQASGVPDGWRLVPIEPTDEMSEAAWESDATDYVGEHKRIHRADLAYKAMLSAAPTPPKSASVPVERLEAFVTQHGGNATHACDENEVLASLAELIAEYKA